MLCEKNLNLGFFSGFHRHGALRDPLDSFTANFCHPNGLTALIGAYMLNKLSPNIQVSPGIHNVEAQYIKAAKNMASIFAGFGYEYHQQNPGILPTLLTLLLNQCLDQAATVSMLRKAIEKRVSLIYLWWDHSLSSPCLPPPPWAFLRRAVTMQGPLLFSLCVTRTCVCAREKQK